MVIDIIISVVVIIAFFVIGGAVISTRREAVQRDEARRVAEANMYVAERHKQKTDEMTEKITTDFISYEKKTVREMTKAMSGPSGNASNVVINFQGLTSAEVIAVQMLTNYKAMDGVKLAKERHNIAVGEARELKRRPFVFGSTDELVPGEFLVDSPEIDMGIEGINTPVDERRFENIIDVSSEEEVTDTNKTTNKKFDDL